MTDPTVTLMEVAAREITHAYASWHCCALREYDIRSADKRRGLYVGGICDSCEESIEAHILNLIATAIQPS